VLCSQGEQVAVSLVERRDPDDAALRRRPGDWVSYDSRVRLSGMACFGSYDLTQ
jgi:hypothetical protein